MKVIATIFDVLTVLAAAVSGFMILDMLATAATGGLNNMALAATSAFAAAIVLVPYCIAGSFHRGAVRSLLSERVE